MSQRVPEFRLDTMNKADGLDLLRGTPESYSKLVIFDPQYRHLMERMKYGCEGKRQKGRALLPQQGHPEICAMGVEIERILTAGGYVMLWCDKFILGEGIAPAFFPNLKRVDLMTWDKGKIGMGTRTRRRSEYAIFFQKAPHVARTKKLVTWKTMPCIPDVWLEPEEKDKIHTHQKPLLLQQAVIEATTERDDVVIDPVAGSFSVMHAAHACDRRFLGGDILGAPGKVDSAEIDDPFLAGPVREAVAPGREASRRPRNVHGDRRESQALKTL